jgi:trimethylamine--corrinoid protein Co-methyltransferase
MTGSQEMMVVCDEVIGVVRRLLQGIQVTPETLAVDTIHEVGPGGSFLMAEHTVRHCREAWYPRLFDRQVHPAWVKAGEPTASRSAREVARHALATHEPTPLTSGILETLAAVTAEADRRHAG